MSRLAGSSQHLFPGAAIERSRPLSFRLDGRIIHGFAGDSVLSAALAAGIDTAGPYHGAPLALTPAHAPAIAPARAPEIALPMARTPAIDGADYITLGPRRASSRLGRLFARRQRSLGLDLGAMRRPPRPWLAMEAETGPPCDLVVIGAGVAGLSAALAGARRGLKVVLIEAAPHPGGHARLFGSQEGEAPVEAHLAQLIAAVAASEAITLLTGCEALALRQHFVRCHQVRMDEGKVQARMLDLHPRHIVLASGIMERLPVFPGNRLPGVIGALDAFTLAQDFGVWPGKSALVATSTNPSYRLAMLARDAGIALPRIIDSRLQPQSRFIEFSRAYGITQASGTIVESVQPQGRALVVTPRLAVPGWESSEAAVTVDRLVLGGGFFPALGLWFMAGGDGAWHASSAYIGHRGTLPGIALAGSAAGWQTRSACAASGADAVDLLLGRKRRPFEDHIIDPLYETPDDPPPFSTAPPRQPGFFGTGWHRLQSGSHLRALETALDPDEIAAGVQSGHFAAEEAAQLVRERAGLMLPLPPEASPPGPGDSLPPYLHGRYPDARLLPVQPAEPRLLQAGTLIHADADQTDPLRAIGVILRADRDGALALIAGAPDQTAYAREADRAIALTLVK